MTNNYLVEVGVDDYPVKNEQGIAYVQVCVEWDAESVEHLCRIQGVEDFNGFVTFAPYADLTVATRHEIYQRAIIQADALAVEEAAQERDWDVVRDERFFDGEVE